MTGIFKKGAKLGHTGRIQCKHQDVHLQDKEIGDVTDISLTAL